MKPEVSLCWDDKTVLPIKTSKVAGFLEILFNYITITICSKKRLKSAPGGAGRFSIPKEVFSCSSFGARLRLSGSIGVAMAFAGSPLIRPQVLRGAAHGGSGTTGEVDR